jgi:hypothetical protein
MREGAFPFRIVNRVNFPIIPGLVTYTSIFTPAR